VRLCVVLSVLLILGRRARGLPAHYRRQQESTSALADFAIAATRRKLQHGVT
jgi:hypothetical protein